MEVFDLEKTFRFGEPDALLAIGILLGVEVNHLKMGSGRGWLYVYGDQTQIAQFKEAAERYNYLQYSSEQQGDSEDDI